MKPDLALYPLWFGWLLTWIVVAPWNGRAVKRPGLGLETVFIVLVVAGTLLLFKFTPFPGYDIQHMFWNTLSGEHGWWMFGVAFAAFVFCWWARVNLGFQWSGSSTRRRKQYIIDKGAYRVVRHPIYVGVTVAAFATAAVFGTPSSLAGAVMLMIAFVFRAFLEERFLRRELGRDSYDDYAGRVPMIVPFFPTWSARHASIERTPPQVSMPDLPPVAEAPPLPPIVEAGPILPLPPVAAPALAADLLKAGTDEPDLFPATVALMTVPPEAPAAAADEFDPEEALAAAELKAAEEEAALMPSPEPQVPDEGKVEAAPTPVAGQPDPVAPAEPVAPPAASQVKPAASAATNPAKPAAPAVASPAKPVAPPVANQAKPPAVPGPAGTAAPAAQPSLSEAMSITNR